MYRIAMEQLLKWKSNTRRKPLIIEGARQVGKTWLMKEFGKQAYDTSSQIIPVEVKAEINLRAKSLRTYCEKYKPEIAVRTSMADFKKEDWLINLPLYAIDYLPKL